MSRISRAARKALRTFVQLIVSGGLTALVSAVAGGLAPQTAVIVLAAWQVCVTYLQNAMEDAGTIPTVLPSPAAPGLPAPLITPGGPKT